MYVAVIFINNKTLYYRPKIKGELTEEFVENPNLITFKKMGKDYERYQLFQQGAGSYLLPYDFKRDIGIKFKVINRVKIKKIIVNSMNNKVVIEHSHSPVRYLNIDPKEGYITEYDDISLSK